MESIVNEAEPNVERAWWTVAAVSVGLAYLGWRSVATLDGVPAWLGWPVLGIEALGVLGVIVLLLGLARQPLHTDGTAHATAKADVILRVEAEPLGRIAASLAGLRRAENVASTTILTFSEREDVRHLAAEHGIEVYYVDPEVDATGLQMALRVGKSPFLIVLDAGDVPMPNMADVLVRHAYDGHVAGVRGAVDSWATDSAEHDSRGNHLLRFEREVLYPAAGRAAVLHGSGVLLRRWAIEHVGVPKGPRRTVELRLSMRLRKAGLDVVAPADPVLVSVYAANTGAAVALERRRDTAAALRMLGSTDGPLLARGLQSRDRIALLATFVRPLSGIRRALFVTAIVASLLTGELPMRGPVSGFVVLWLPWMLLQSVALRSASLGRLDWGDRARWSFSTIGSSVAAMFGAGDPVIGAGRTQPRHGAFKEFTSNRPITATLAGLAVVVPLVAISDRFTGWLPPMPMAERAALLAVTMWAIAVMLDVMRCLNGARQLRRAPRIATEFPGSVGDLGATIVDLTPYGAGAITDEPVDVGQEVHVCFDVPSARDRTSVVAVGVVRSVRTTPHGSVSGIEFISMDYASSDALYEYCEVIHSQGHFATRSRSRAERRAQPQIPRVMVPSRRIGVRLSAALVLLGVAVTTAPPFRTLEAAPVAAGGAITVTMFQDHNANGIRNLAADSTNPALDTGVPGATVTATCLTDDGGDTTAGTGDGETYSSAVTAVDAGGGVYNLTNLPGTPCRIEVTALPTGFEPGPLGVDNGGLVQFAGAGAVVSIGVNSPDEFCQDNPTLVTSCMTFGDPVYGAGADFATIKSFSYNASGSLWGGPVPSETPVTLATNKEIGSVFGLEYQRATRMLYLAAYTKVYAGFGPGGPGAIYQIDPSTGGATVFATIPNAGSLPARAGYAPNPNSVSGDWLQDGQYWNAVGTTSLGDLQLSPDGSTLWVVNLADRQLYPVDTATATVGTPVAIPLATVAVGACAAPDVRPFGLGRLDGQLLVGSVCSGPATNDLRMYVYGFDPIAGSFTTTPLFESSLVYTRGRPGNSCGPNGALGNWNPWTTRNVFNGSSTPVYCAYTQPMLSDIEVDDDGALILGIRDRFGDQAGEDVPAGTSGGGGEGVSGGELLRACPSGGTWVLESNGVCGGRTSLAVGDTQGPGGKEFYSDGFATPTGTGSNHQEVSIGGLAKVPGFTTVAHTVFDPSTTNGSDWRAGGIRRNSNQNGLVSGFFQLFDKCDSSGVACPVGRTKTLTFGKVNGLGDLVALCDMAPVEVGNRVWADENGNGVQDPGEPAVPGVPVSLQIGSSTYAVVTDGNGVYRFSSDGRFSDALGVDFGVPQMTEGATATISFPPTVTIGGAPRPITRRDAAGSNDAIDSDADEGTGQLTITVGGAGDNDHTYDAGYASRYSVGDFVWDDRNNDGTFQVGEPGIDGVTVRLMADGDDNGVPDGPALASQTTSSGGYYRFTDLATGTYVVEVETPSGFKSSTGQNTSATGPYEGAATPDPDTVAIDGDDNGTATDSSGTIVRSASVSLGSFEPIGEPATPGHPDAAEDRRANATVDFGFFRPLSIGNLVWDDADDSGTVDSGETGISGVTVLLRQGSTVLDSTTSDVDGRYLFTLLSSGQYEVEVVAPGGYLTSTGRNGAGDSEPGPDADLDNDDDDDNGTNVFGGIRTATLDLTTTAEPTADDDTSPVGVTDPAADADANYTVDFGLWRPVSIGNLVWSDVDDDGIYDIGEPGVPGVPVRLFAADGTTEIEIGPDGALDTSDDAPGGMTTDANGRYRFTNLRPATYRVQVAVPSGWRTSSVADSGDANDDTDNDNNGGPRATGNALAGHVELSVGTEPVADGDSDASSNLTVDVGLFQPSPSMTLMKATNGCDADTPTGAIGPSGGCPPGDGSTNPVIPIGGAVTWSYLASNTGNVALDNAGITDDRILQDEIDCNAGGPGNGQPFTLAVGATLTCTAMGVATGGQYDNTATLAADAELTPGTVGPLTPVTEMSHHFGSDPGLAIKTYTLLTDPGSTVGGLLTGAAPPVTGTDDADLPGGIDMVANHVIPDGTGVWWAYAVTNTGNVQLSDVQVVDDRRGLVCQGVTLAAGATSWCVLPGPIGSSDTVAGQYGNVGTATGVDTISNPSVPTNVGPVSDPTHAFVPTPAVTIKKYTNDEDADTAPTRPQVDAGAGVVWRYVVTNSGNWPLSAIVVSDDLEGSVSCPVLPGAPSRLLPGQSVTCTETGVSTPQFGGADYVNLGSVTGTPVPPSTGSLPNPIDDDPSGYRPLVASIGDRVWLDGDVDGVQDGGEPGVAAVTVRLLTPADVVVATTATDANGLYLFAGVNPGTYLLEFVPPADHLVTVGDVGADDAVDSDVDVATRRTVPVRLDGGENDLTWDLGLYRLASLGDRVWLDTDLDGVQDDGEAPVVGVTVRLFTAGGTSLAATTTDGDGLYAFTGLRPGSYVVQFEVPAGYTATVHDVGVGPAADAVDSDAHPITGQSALVELESGEDDRTIDAGIFQRAGIGDRVWDDADQDGVQDRGEQGVAGVVVSLYGPAGTAVDSTLTDVEGIYRFAGLQPGAWSIGVSNLPTGMTVAGLDRGGDDATDSDIDPVTGRTVVTDLAPGEIDPTWDAGIHRDPASNVPPPGSPGSTGSDLPSSSRLPVTGAEALQLLVFASALLMIGLLMIRARRPRTL